MTYWTWGAYSHPSGEVNLAKMSITHNLSPRGLKMERVERMHLYGQFCEDSTSEVMTRIDELIAAYSVDYQDGGLYLDDGTPTRHLIQNGESISGSHVIHRSWDGGPDELATTRTFDIIIETVYPDVESQLIYWEESVRVVGTGGPKFEVTDTWNGPLYTQVAANTKQSIIQSGKAVGWSAYVEPPAPIYPAYLHNELASVERGSGKMRGQLATHYPISWTYYMTLPLPGTAIPITR